MDGGQVTQGLVVPVTGTPRLADLTEEEMRGLMGGARSFDLEMVMPDDGATHHLIVWAMAEPEGPVNPHMTRFAGRTANAALADYKFHGTVFVTGREHEHAVDITEAGAWDLSRELMYYTPLAPDGAYRMVGMPMAM